MKRLATSLTPALRCALVACVAALCTPGLMVCAQDATPPPSQTIPAPPSAATATSVVQPAAQARQTKAKKNEYTGPTTVIELPATPMLDEEGKQRLDPDGKPMFNAPVFQQRDKHGHPLFDEAGKPVFQTAKDMGYDEHGKKIKLAKEKPPKMTPVHIERGTLTVDGLIGKAALNYDIADLKYIYMYAPGIGIAVVSNEPFPGATLQKNAFHDNALTISVGEHRLELASDRRILDKKPEPAYVLLDREFVLPSKFPVIGYGTIRKAPYAWPGSKANTDLGGPVKPPPLSANLLPVQLLAPCPAGQMRPAGPKVLPGQSAPVQPCVPIAKVVPPNLRSSAAAKPGTAAAAASTAASSSAVPVPAPAAGSPAPSTPANTH